jgi:hypothetical protein
MEQIKTLIGPVAKAVAGALVPVALFLVGWLVEQTGVPIDVDTEKVSQWIYTGVASALTYIAVWWTRNAEKTS